MNSTEEVQELFNVMVDQITRPITPEVRRDLKAAFAGMLANGTPQAVTLPFRRCEISPSGCAKSVICWKRKLHKHNAARARQNLRIVVLNMSDFHLDGIDRNTRPIAWPYDSDEEVLRLVQKYPGLASNGFGTLAMQRREASLAAATA